MKKLLTLVLIFAVSFSISGQDKKAITKKLSGISGKTEKITITTDKDEVTFTGEEAEYLLNQLKQSKKEKRIKMILSDDDKSDNDVVVWTGNDEETFYIDDDSISTFNFSFENNDSLSVEKRIEIKIEDGNKTIEVKTLKDGKETVEIYEGDKADEFLEKNKTSGKEIKKTKKIIINK